MVPFLSSMQLELNEPTDSTTITWFADVVLPVPLNRLFTYRLPKDWEPIHAGSRIIVPFGARKVLTGIIYECHNNPPKDYEAKYILEVLDQRPSIVSQQFKLFDWIANYYMCTLGEVLNSGLLTGLKVSSESKVQLNPFFDLDDTLLDSKEEMLVSALSKRDSLTYQEIIEILGVKTISGIIKSLIQKEAIIIFETIRERFSPKIEKRIRLQREWVPNEVLEGLLEKLDGKPKQLEILLKYLQQVPVHDDPDLNNQGNSKREMIATGISSSSLKTLVKNQILEEFEVIISRFPEEFHSPAQVNLNAEQTRAYQEIHHCFESNSVALLHGITGSGKTEIYIKLIEETIEAGNQVLYLLPEIALTTQIMVRLKKIFGSRMGVYHSKFSDNERVEVWNGLLDGKYDIVLGVRSSIFLPFNNLGLIIVDEEHEPSYKQMDPAPRFHARDTALILAQIHHAKTLLGTATPSLETMHNAVSNKYGLIRLNERYNDAVLPNIMIADIGKERKKKTMRSEFSSILHNQIATTLENSEQIILFQNRRGYSPFLSCGNCAWIPKCPNCSVSLTYHMFSNELRCHYCSHAEANPGVCIECGGNDLKTVNYGTEKIEEDVKLIFPKATVARMDLDTTRSKYGYQQIINDFSELGTDILVGTQMLSKGLDFNNVQLVGVMDFDRMLHFPDFRAHERTFNLVTQVSGRSGRRAKQGLVVIQTTKPDNQILKYIVDHDYTSFYESEIQERKAFKFPPFSRLIRTIVKHSDLKISVQGAAKLADIFRSKLGAKVIYGPQEPVISKIRNKYLQEIVIKLLPQDSPSKTKTILIQERQQLLLSKEFKGLIVQFDVDPY